MIKIPEIKDIIDGTWLLEHYDAKIYIDCQDHPFQRYSGNNFSIDVKTNSIKQVCGILHFYKDLIILQVMEVDGLNITKPLSIVFEVVSFSKNKISLIDLYSNIGRNISANRFFEKFDIKNFEFEELIDITIAELKEILGIGEIPLSTLKDRRSNKYRYWNFEDRFEIIVGKELAGILRANPSYGINVEKVINISSKGYYTRLIVTPYKGSHEEYINKEAMREERSQREDNSYYNTDNYLIDAAGTDDPEIMNDVEWNLN